MSSDQQQTLIAASVFAFLVTTYFIAKNSLEPEKPKLTRSFSRRIIQKDLPPVSKKFVTAGNKVDQNDESFNGKLLDG